MKNRLFALSLLAALLLFAGCSVMQSPSATSAPAADMNSSYDSGMSKPQAAPMVEPQTEAAVADMDMETQDDASAVAGWGTSAGQYVNNSEYGGHKIIKNASLGIETRAFDEHLAHIRQKANEMGGYVASSSTSGRKPEVYGDYGRNASITVRIPQARMEAFLLDARGLATVTYENNYSDDITSAYYDTESRLQIYETQRGRILKLLEQAESMEDIIALETELSRLTYDIEALTTQLKRYDDLVDFSTINIELAEIPPSTPVSSNESVGTRISDGFSGTLNGMAVFFEGLLVYFLAASPVLLLLAAITIITLLLVRRKRRRNKQAKIESMQQTPAPQYDEKK